jgi:hypothetical protein
MSINKVRSFSFVTDTCSSIDSVVCATRNNSTDLSSSLNKVVANSSDENASHSMHPTCLFVHDAYILRADCREDAHPQHAQLDTVTSALTAAALPAHSSGTLDISTFVMPLINIDDLGFVGDLSWCTTAEGTKLRHRFVNVVYSLLRYYSPKYVHEPCDYEALLECLAQCIEDCIRRASDHLKVYKNADTADARAHCVVRFCSS